MFELYMSKLALDFPISAYAPRLAQLTPALSGIGRLCHIGHGFLRFSLILFNSERKICSKVM